MMSIIVTVTILACLFRLPLSISLLLEALGLLPLF